LCATHIPPYNSSRAVALAAVATACALSGPEGTPPGPTAWIHTQRPMTGERARANTHTHAFKPLCVALAIRRDVSRIPSPRVPHSCTSLMVVRSRLTKHSKLSRNVVAAVSNIDSSIFNIVIINFFFLTFFAVFYRVFRFPSLVYLFRTKK